MRIEPPPSEPGRERQQARGDRDRGSAAGAAGSALEVVRGARRGVGERLGVARHPELGGVGLAEADGARVVEGEGELVGLLGHVVGEERATRSAVRTPARATRSLSASGRPHSAAAFGGAGHGIRPLERPLGA